MDNSKPFYTSFLFMFLFLLTNVSTKVEALEYDWTRWRGPEGTGISEETDWNPSALNGGAKILWKVNVGNGYSCFAIKGDYLYTMGNDGKEDTVTCLEAETGRVVWDYSYTCTTGGYPGPRATPYIDDGKVYTLSRVGDLFCLDASNGKVIWSKNITREFGARPPNWHFAGSPVIDGDLLILNACTSGIALNKKNGRKVWASKAGTGGYAAPVLFDYGGRRLAAIFGLNALYCVNVATGDVQWSYPWVTDSNVNAADPIVVGNKIFISSGYDHGCALLEMTGGKPKLLWRNTLMRNHFSSCIYLDGYIYGSDGNVGGGYLRCLDFQTGKEMWAQKSLMVSLVAAGGKLIALDERGTQGIYFHPIAINISNNKLLLFSSQGNIWYYDLQ
jgi:FOG: WD40-like repeat